jgi:hypothetical protein
MPRSGDISRRPSLIVRVRADVLPGQLGREPQACDVACWSCARFGRERLREEACFDLIWARSF